jgi:hypothetical protein
MPDKDYSHRSVIDKLGIKPGDRVAWVGVTPRAAGVRELAAGVAERAGAAVARGAAPVNLILYWPEAFAEVVPRLLELKGRLVRNGGIWVNTAKRGKPAAPCRAANGAGYLMQDSLIPLGKAAGLVDNKICSLSDCESAMRFVIPKRNRAG